MDAMQDLYLQKLARWQNFMEVFSLPGWEELPDMDLYVDQVVTLVSRYLNLIPQDEKNPLITASSINNYVRLAGHARTGPEALWSEALGLMS